MRRTNSATVFMIALLLLIGALAVGAFSFLGQMGTSQVLIYRGSQPDKIVLDNYKYMQNKRGFIFSVTFIVVVGSFAIMIALPSEETRIVGQVAPAPQPVSAAREESAISAIVEPQAPFEGDEAGPPDQAKAVDPAEEEVIEAIEPLEADVMDEDTEGEDDVVYGTGQVSDVAIMQFVHKFPDSALKFLFRKQLDGKALSNSEEEIYQSWEKREMTRGKVKGYIQTLMGWKDFPKKPLYEIWQEIRDHIFENID
jgi:hypothetical protein